MPRQQQAKWCWAAVSNAVAHYYNAQCAWTQCSIADGCLGRSDCCGSGGLGPCNTSWRLNLALRLTSHLKAMIASPAGYPILQSEIDGNNPIGCRVGWMQGGGHFLAVFGYDDGAGPNGQDMLDVADPIYGKSRYTYNDFRTRYQGTGMWTHSYTCKP